jgi:hypothetical protein
VRNSVNTIFFKKFCINTFSNKRIKNQVREKIVIVLVICILSEIT